MTRAGGVLINDDQPASQHQSEWGLWSRVAHHVTGRWETVIGLRGSAGAGRAPRAGQLVLRNPAVCSNRESPGPRVQGYHRSAAAAHPRCPQAYPQTRPIVDQFKLLFFMQMKISWILQGRQVLKFSPHWKWIAIRVDWPIRGFPDELNYSSIVAMSRSL